MAWIESHQELRDHPKTKRLARRLCTSLPCAIGHLHLLWWWAVDYAPDGDLSRFEDGDIADAVLWQGNPTALLDALIQSGFIDPDRVIHDWDVYAGRLIEQREQAKERVRRWRSARKQATYPDVTHNVSVTNAQRMTQHDMTIPNITIPNITAAAADARAHEDAAAAPPPRRDYVAILTAEGWTENEIADAKASVLSRDNPPVSVSSWANYLRPILAEQRSAGQQPANNGAGQQPVDDVTARALARCRKSAT